MKRMFALLPAIAVLAALSVYVYFNFLSMPVETQNCGSDIACIREMEAKKEECIPSSTIISGRDGIILMVNITREGDRCIRTENIIGTGPESDYLIGHNVTCEDELSELGYPEKTVCPGSLYDYVMSSEGGGGSPGGGPLIPGIPEFNCGLEDNECKDEAITYIESCANCKIISTDLRWEPEGYWTTFTNVSRQTQECLLYLEVLNAVNLPPGTPTAIIGSNMTCDIPLSEFPLSVFNSTWCEGSLYDYLHP